MKGSTQSNMCSIRPWIREEGLMFQLLLDKIAPRLLSFPCPFMGALLGSQLKTLLTAAGDWGNAIDRKVRVYLSLAKPTFFLFRWKRRRKSTEHLSEQQMAQEQMQWKGMPRLSSPISSLDGFPAGSSTGEAVGPGAGSRWFALPRAMCNGQRAAPHAGQATADGLQFAPLKDIFHVMCGKEQ